MYMTPFDEKSMLYWYCVCIRIILCVCVCVCACVRVWKKEIIKLINMVLITFLNSYSMVQSVTYFVVNNVKPYITRKIILLHLRPRGDQVLLHLFMILFDSLFCHNLR